MYWEHKNYEDKYNFLFEITQESRNPLKNIEELCAEIKDEKDISKIKAGTIAISGMAQQLDFTINNIMNVSSLDAQKLNIIEKKYKNCLSDEKGLRRVYAGCQRLGYSYSQIRKAIEQMNGENADEY